MTQPEAEFQFNLFLGLAKVKNPIISSFVHIIPNMSRAIQSYHFDEHFYNLSRESRCIMDLKTYNNDEYSWEKESCVVIDTDAKLDWTELNDNSFVTDNLENAIAGCKRIGAKDAYVVGSTSLILESMLLAHNIYYTLFKTSIDVNEDNKEKLGDLLYPRQLYMFNQAIFQANRQWDLREMCTVLEEDKLLNMRRYNMSRTKKSKEKLLRL
jgi:dihydrofolate reductase